MSLSRILPAPIKETFDRDYDPPNKSNRLAIQAVGSTTAPPYGHRRGWVPRVQQDFGDGGAYPECLVVQYPLGMGEKKSTSNALAVTLDAEGKIDYDILARQGHASDRVVHSKFQDLLPKRIDEDDPELQKPDDERVMETTEKTRAALEKLVSSKIAAAMPIQAADKQAPAEYIRYTPAQQGLGFNSGAKQRVIRMVEAQKDPMEPPKFKTNKKIPRGPPSPPAPVMHSPNRKVTTKEQQEWKIPPCISNWKNAKGFTISLDKRMAADGRGLQSVHINENFSKLAEALYIADRKAREAVEVRAQLEKKMAQKEQQRKEENLRVLAQKARDERAGVAPRRPVGPDSGGPSGGGGGGNLSNVGEDIREREELRRDRARERQRDRNLARAAPDKRNRLQKERERDISEQIALGKAQPTTATGEGVFDQRLFNQSKGLDSGFKGGEDESYDVYDKPWRKDQNLAGHLYRPTKSSKESTTTRSGPVQFEKDVDDDIFGLNRFLTAVRWGEKRGAEKGPESLSSSSSSRNKSKKRKSDR